MKSTKLDQLLTTLKQRDAAQRRFREAIQRKEQRSRQASPEWLKCNQACIESNKALTALVEALTQTVQALLILAEDFPVKKQPEIIELDAPPKLPKWCPRWSDRRRASNLEYYPSSIDFEHRKVTAYPLTGSGHRLVLGWKEWAELPKLPPHGAPLAPTLDPRPRRDSNYDVFVPLEFFNTDHGVGTVNARLANGNDTILFRDSAWFALTPVGEPKPYRNALGHESGCPGGGHCACGKAKRKR